MPEKQPTYNPDIFEYTFTADEITSLIPILIKTNSTFAIPAEYATKKHVKIQIPEHQVADLEHLCILARLRITGHQG